MLDIYNNELNIQKPTVHFEFSTFKAVPIISFEQKDINDISTISIHANFKDCLLHLFHDDLKEFLLTIFYTTKDKKEYATSFSVSLPKVEKNVDWKPIKRDVNEYNPDEFCGIELKILFEKHFSNYPGIKQPELNMLESLKKYKEANIEDRFNEFNFLDMFQYMIAIEDLECIRKIRDQSVDFARIFKYKSCPVFLRKKIDRYLAKFEKEDKDYSNKIHIIQTKKKLPADDFDFSAVNVSI